MTTAVLAHAGHWYHSALYILPVALIAIGLWWSGRHDSRPVETEADSTTTAEDEPPSW